MNDFNLVKYIDEEAYTTSRKIADKFGKKHCNVLRDMENMLSKFGDSDSRREMFIETTYKNRGRDYKEYLVSQDGLTLYLFNIQGFVEEKMAYINEFNRMKKLITDLQLGKPEAIIGLLTWKNDNMATTIRKYVNSNNVLNVLPAIANECKKQISNGEMKLEVLTTAIETVKSMKEQETDLADRDKYSRAIEEVSKIRDRILIGRLGGLTASKNRMENRYNKLKSEAYDDEVFKEFINDRADEKDYAIYCTTMHNFVTYIVEHTSYGYSKVYKDIYLNVTSRYNNLFLPSTKAIKDNGYKSISEYYYFNYGMELLSQFLSEAQSWVERIGGYTDEDEQ